MNRRVFLSICLVMAAYSMSSCELASICGRDTDEDGINNCDDVCPFHADNEIIDRKKFESLECDCEDSDGDGIIDCLDVCPYHANLEPTICGCDAEPEGEGIFVVCPDVEGVADRCPNDPNKLAPGVCGCGVSDRLIVWDDDALTEGNPRSECPTAENMDLCPFDPNKIAPGQCGCGVEDIDTDGDTVPDCIDECPGDEGKKYPGTCGCGSSDGDSDGDTIIDCQDGCPTDSEKNAPGICGCNVPDIDSDGDNVMDCLDKCPDDPRKQELGVCGCGVEDSAQNLKDTDNDGVVDCADKCPLNPYKISPEPTTCDEKDIDGDGVEDGDDPCPYNPNIHAMNADGSAPDCNYVTDESGQRVFQIWDASDLARLREILDNEVTPLGKHDMICDTKVSSDICIGEYDGPSSVFFNSSIIRGIYHYLGTSYKTCETDDLFEIQKNNVEMCKNGCGYFHQTSPDIRVYSNQCFGTSEELIEGMHDYIDQCISLDVTSNTNTPWHVCVDDHTAFDCRNGSFVDCSDECYEDECATCSGSVNTTGGVSGECCDPDSYQRSCASGSTVLACNGHGVITELKCMDGECSETSSGVKCKTCNGNMIKTGGAAGDCCNPQLYQASCTGDGVALSCSKNGQVVAEKCAGDCLGNGNFAFCKSCHGDVIDTGGNDGDCCDQDTYIDSCVGNDMLTCNDSGRVQQVHCMNSCRSDGEFVSCIKSTIPDDLYRIELMRDIDMSSLIPSNTGVAGCMGNWEPLDLYHTNFEGHGHSIRFTTNFGNTRCAISKPLFDNIYESKVHDLTMDIDVRGETNGGVARYVYRSILDGVGYKGDALVGSSIYGSAAEGQFCVSVSGPHLVGKPQQHYSGCKRVYGGLAGFVRDSELHHVSVSGNLVSGNSDYEIAGLIGASENVSISDVSIQLYYLYSKNTEYSPSDFGSYYSLSASSALVLYPFEVMEISGVHAKIDKVESDEFCGISKTQAYMSLNDYDLIVERQKTRMTNAVICDQGYQLTHLESNEKFESSKHLEMSNYSLKTESIESDTVELFSVSNVANLSGISISCDDIVAASSFSGINVSGTWNQNGQMNNVDLHVNSVRTQDNSYDGAEGFQISNMDANNIYLYYGNLNDNGAASLMSFRSSTSENVSLQVDTLSHSYNSRTISYSTGTYRNHHIYLPKIIFDDYASNGYEGIMQIFKTAAIENFVVITDPVLNAYTAVESDEDDEYQLESTSHVVGPLISVNYPDFDLSNINKVYWLKYYSSNYAFGTQGNPDENDDGSVFIPFTHTQTDAVVKTLGDSWTKYNVRWYNTETGKTEDIVLPTLK